MRRFRTGAFLGVCVTGAALAICATNCASPTQIQVDVRTNKQLCAGVGAPGGISIQSTGIAITTPDNIDNAELTIIQGPGCLDPPGDRIGVLTIVPSGAKDAEVGIRIVAGIRSRAEACVAPDYKDCIVARRVVKFVPNETLPITVLMSIKCVDVQCAAADECDPETGLCVPRAQVQDDGGVTPTIDAAEETPIRPPDQPDTGPDAPIGPVDAGFDACANCKGTCGGGGSTCTVNCDGTNDCSATNVCGAGIGACAITCSGNAKCTTTSCSNTGGTCDFNCKGGSGGPGSRCINIACSASTCTVECKDEDKACNGVHLDGGTNTVTCAAVGDNVSCDDVSCTSAGGTCKRTCDNADAGGCGQLGACAPQSPATTCAAWVDGGGVN